jgi:translation initiation factor 1
MGGSSRLCSLAGTDRPSCVRLYSEGMTDRNARTVYSTGPGGVCAGCGWPIRNCTCSRKVGRDEPLPARIVAKLRIEKSGRGGKIVTVVYDLPRNQPFLQELARELKRACGAGGTVMANTVEIQGDLRDRIRAALEKKGWTVKG